MWCKELLVTIIVLLLFMAFMFWKLLERNSKMIIWDLMNWFLVVHRNPVVNWNKIHVNYPLSTTLLLLFISIFWGLINVISACRENLRSHRNNLYWFWLLSVFVFLFCWTLFGRNTIIYNSLSFDFVFLLTTWVQVSGCLCMLLEFLL